MLLLDTCALIWLFAGIGLTSRARAAIENAGWSGGVIVSAVSLWEIGSVAHRPNPPIVVEPDPERWLQSVLEFPGVRAVPLTLQAALSAAFLPEPFHRDPADRLLVAQAREMDVPIVTRDRRILDYSDRGHVRAVPC